MRKSRYYSYTLVVSQFVCIALLLYLNQVMFTKLISLMFFILGIGFFLYTLFHNKLSNFNIIPDIKENATLITTGAYKIVRHPMYFAVIITMFAPLSNAFNFTNILICILLCMTLFLKAKKEEGLWSEESKEYRKYKLETKMIIPFCF